MSSTLARQVAQLGVIDKERLYGKGEKERDSYLFDRRTAANYDIETIYQIAWNGLLDLENTVGGFAAFEETLFSEASKRFDRTVSTREENKECDELIDDFLTRLGPCLLTKSAAKALEWLIRRYAIHKLNVDALMITFLPYLETNQFARILQIAYIEDHPVWYIFSNAKKSREPFTRSLLVRAVSSNLSILDQIAKRMYHTEGLGLSHPPLIGFYGTLFLKLVEVRESNRFDEAILVRVLALVFDGLKIHHSLEVQTVHILVASALTLKVHLAQEASRVLLTAVLDPFAGGDTMPARVLALAHIVQTQEIMQLDDESVQSLARIDNLARILFEAKDKFNIQPFLDLLLRQSKGEPILARLRDEMTALSKPDVDHVGIEREDRWSEQDVEQLLTFINPCVPFTSADIEEIQATLQDVEELPIFEVEHDVNRNEDESRDGVVESASLDPAHQAVKTGQAEQIMKAILDQLKTDPRNRTLLLRLLPRFCQSSIRSLAISATIILTHCRSGFPDDTELPSDLFGTVTSRPDGSLIKAHPIPSSWTEVYVLQDPSLDDLDLIQLWACKTLSDCIRIEHWSLNAFTPRSKQMEMTAMWNLLAVRFEPMAAFRLAENVAAGLKGSLLAVLSMMLLSPHLADAGRVLALEVMHRTLKAHQSSPTSNDVDLQLILPSLLACCTSPFAQIRGAALRVLHCFKTVNAWGGRIYAAELFDEVTRRLGKQEGFKLLTQLLACHVNVQKDAKAMAHLLADSLTGCTIDPKLEASESQHVLSLICNFVSAIKDREMHSGLLELLRHYRGSKKVALLALPVLNYLGAVKKQSTISEDYANLLLHTAEGAKVDPDALPDDYTTELISFIKSGAGIEVAIALYPLVTRQLKAISRASGDRQILHEINEALVDAASDRSIPTSLARKCQQILDVDVTGWHDLIQKKLDSFQTAVIPARKRPKLDGARRQESADMNRMIIVIECVQSNVAVMSPLLCSDLLHLVELLCRDTLETTASTLILLQMIFRILQDSLTASPIVQDSAKLWPVDVFINALQQVQDSKLTTQIISIIGSLTQFAPELVLRYTTPLLTYMGANIVQRDDATTLKSISGVLQTVLPLVVQAATFKDNRDQDQREMLNLFVDTIPHIPSHRRIRFVREIVHASGADWFLGAIVCLLNEASERPTDTTKQDLSGLSFEILKSFGASQKTQAIFFIVSRITALAQPDHASSTLPASWPRLSTPTELEADLKAYQSKLLQLVDRTLRTISISSLSSSDHALVHSIFDLLTSSTMNEIAQATDSRKMGEAVARNALRLIPAGEAMDILIAQLESEAMPESLIYDLLIGLLSQLRAQSAQSASALDKLLESLARQFDRHNQRRVRRSKSDRLLAVCRIAILRSTKDQLSSLTQLAEPLIRSISTSAQNCGLAMTTLQCMTPLLGPRLLPYLQDIVDSSILLISSSKAPARSAALDLLVQLYQSIPSFMGPHTRLLLPPILQQMSNASTANEEELRHVDIFLVTMIKRTPAKDLLSALSGVSEQSTCCNEKAIGLLIDIYGVFLRRADRPFVVDNRQMLFDMHRTLLGRIAIDIPKMEILLDSVSNSLLEMVMKLNEKLFRPLFANLHDWAYIEAADLDRAIAKGRSIVFLHLVERLLDLLKEIFLPIFSLAFDQTIAQLNESVSTSLDLRAWDSLMRVLTRVFAQATEGYWESRRFSMIVDPLVEQVNRADRLGPERSQSILSSTIASFSASLQEQDQLKRLNHGLLMATRSEKASVRLAALHSLDAMWQANGDELLPFVAESVSFFAELLEDDDRHVEDKTKDVVKSVEGHLGESLETYLR